MRDCPKGCGAVLADDAICCNTCGWQAPKANADAAARHPVHGYRLCEHEDRGQRCGNPGSLSQNLREGGPWYCADHFPPFRNWNSAEPTLPPSGFQALRDVLPENDPLPDSEKKHDKRDWARRVLWRLKRGEKVAPIAVNAAREVLPSYSP